MGGQTSAEVGSNVKDRLDANIHRRLELANQRDGAIKRFAHYVFHDFRTTAASTLQGAPYLVLPAVNDAMLLHVPPGKVTKIYQRNPLTHEAGEALRLWNDHVDRLMARDDAFPGGRDLPEMDGKERTRRLADFRKGWPLRADQERAIAARKTEEANGGTGKKRRRRS